MTDFPVIDSDGHVFEPANLWVDRMPAKYRDVAPRQAPDNKTLIIGDVEVPPRSRYANDLSEGFWPKEEERPDEDALRAEDDRKRLETAAQMENFSPATHIAAMDVEGIAVSVLFPTRGLALMGADGVDPAITTAAATAYNDWLAEFRSHAPDRLFAVGMIDPRDIGGACEEARRCVDRGFVGVFMRPNQVGGRNWDHPDYEPLWSQLEELDLPMAFHEGGVVLLPQVGSERFQTHAYWHLCNHPMEQQIAMASILLGGVAERHPALRFAFLECGAGWLPYWTWRMDEAVENESKMFPHLSLKPSEYIGRQCFVSIDSDEDTGIYAIEQLGVSNVLWGSDYPHGDGKYPEAVKTIVGLLQPHPGYDRKVLSDAPKAFFGERLCAAAAL